MSKRLYIVSVEIEQMVMAETPEEARNADSQQNILIWKHPSPATLAIAYVVEVGPDDGDSIENNLYGAGICHCPSEWKGGVRVQ